MSSKNDQTIFNLFETKTEETKPTRRYLYVPFSHKDTVKSKGAKFDWDKKKWYIYSDHPNQQELVDLYHSDNFYTDFYGTHLRNSSTTEKTRKEIYEAKQNIRENLKKKWIENHGSDDGFGQWYSVNVITHE